MTNPQPSPGSSVPSISKVFSLHRYFAWCAEMREHYMQVGMQVAPTPAFSRENWRKQMKTILPAIALLVLGLGHSFAQIKGCTADVRTGVCNKNCSVSHVEGCTLEQLKPLLRIHHMDCLAKGTDKAVCSAEVDKAIADWKTAQKKKAQKAKK